MKPFIALDWGTSSFRAYEIDAEGKVKNQVSAAEGILAVKDQKFEETLESHIGGWDKKLPVIASGMITSRQGWIECAYAECPASASDLAKSITQHKTASGRAVHFITGLHLKNDHKIPALKHDVIRGEETQVFGAMAEGATHFITPGTHSKWIEVSKGRIVDFFTYMTGETFALYRHHSILGRLMKDGPADDNAFKAGLERVFSDPMGILHQLFSVRTEGLFNELPPESLPSYLSGLLVGQEVFHAINSDNNKGQYVVLATPALGAAYITALNYFGRDAKLGDPLCAINGQRMIAHEAGVI